MSKDNKVQQTTAKRLDDHRSGRKRLSDEDLRQIVVAAYVEYGTLV